MLRVANRVKESTLTSGSGTIALAGASNGYQSFSSVLSNGDTPYYTIVNVDSWEVGIGTYSSNTLSRDVVLSSSNSNNKLDLNGQSYVFIAYPSEKSVYKDQNDQVVVGSSGVIIGSGNPFITSNVLYNSGGILYFNGLPVNSSVSITGVSGIGVSQSGNSYTISATGSFGLTSGQIQELLNSGVSINVVSGTGNFNSLSVTGTPVSLSGHTHLSSSIINFNTSVSGLLPSVSGSGYARVLLSNNVYTVSVTGLQPSGNYSISGHQHTSSDIINFNSSVSGLLAPYALLNSGNFTTLLVTNVPVSLSGHLHTSSQITDFNSAVSGLLPFTGILGSGYVTLNSSNRILTIGVSGLQPSGNYSLSGHTHIASNITDFNSATSGLLTPYAQLDDAIFNNLAVDTLFTSNAPNFIVDEDGNTSIGANNPLVGVGVPHLSVAYSLSAASGTISSGLNVFNYLRLNNTGVSLSGHSHTVSDISNFDSGVSGLLPVKDILPGTNVTITSNSGIYTINSSGGGGGGGSVSVSDPGSGRLLASDGTSSGIIGQSGLTFIDNRLTVNGVIINNGSNLYMWSNFR